MSRRHELSDEQWERLKDLLPPQKPSTGRPAHDHRVMVKGMLWIATRGTLARLARTLWEMDQRLQSVSTLV